MSGKKILVVDDDPDMRAIVGSYLKSEGHEAVFAQDGVSCVALTQKHRPDLIVLDLGLPAGDGGTVLDRLGNLTALSLIPVLVVTARGRAACGKLLDLPNVVGYLQKPIERDTFLFTIREQLGDPDDSETPEFSCPHCGKDLDPQMFKNAATESARSSKVRG